MIIHAVIDTNVLISALISKKKDSATVLLLEKLFDGVLTPVYNHEILKEYMEVMNRAKFHLDQNDIVQLLNTIIESGVQSERIKTDLFFPDKKDIVFYEVALSVNGTYLITGNTKHFPTTPIVVTPAEMLRIIESEQLSEKI
ncbi:MAG: putative toxin-antitoxin system toxin component, PIN family [Bacteroidaceae bacterium]|nr:putative toxin-antitoxin system toxin component, PIN family [Bacteroidaceae bacterium]